MSVSVEMRVPYVDDRVVAMVAALPVELRVREDIGVQKYLLKRFALRRFGDRLFDIVLRKKLGAPSAGICFLRRFDELCEAALPHDYLERHELGGGFARKRDLLMFEMFTATFRDNRGTPIGSVLDFMDARARDRSAIKTIRDQMAKAGPAF